MITKDEAIELARVLGDANEETAGGYRYSNVNGLATDLSRLFPGLLFRWDGSQFVVTGEPKAQP